EMQVKGKISSSSKPRKKRLALYNAPLHERQKLVAAHLSRELRKQLKKRSLPVRKGDRVFLLKGRFKKKQGLVARVDLENSEVFVEGIVLKTQRGKEKLAPMRASNLVLLELVARKGKKSSSATTQAVEAKKGV
ncbi:MAG: 50S ribosomal protein L24, partial [Candidatus Micrarchaeota archaeon]